jgi:hypothetical protein
VVKIGKSFRSGKKQFLQKTTAHFVQCKVRGNNNFLAKLELKTSWKALVSSGHPDKPAHSQPSQYLPKLFFVKAFYNALLKGYKTEGLTAEKALDNAMMLIQIFELQITKEEVLRKEMLAVMVSAMKDFGEI